MKVVSLKLPESTYESLKAAAARERRSVSSLIREAMEDWLRTHAEAHSGSLCDLPTASCGRPLDDWERSDVFDEMIG